MECASKVAVKCANYHWQKHTPCEALHKQIVGLLRANGKRDCLYQSMITCVNLSYEGLGKEDDVILERVFIPGLPVDEDQDGALWAFSHSLESLTNRQPLVYNNLMLPVGTEIVQKIDAQYCIIELHGVFPLDRQATKLQVSIPMVEYCAEHYGHDTVVLVYFHGHGLWAYYCDEEYYPFVMSQSLQKCMLATTVLILTIFEQESRQSVQTYTSDIVWQCFAQYTPLDEDDVCGRVSTMVLPTLINSAWRSPVSYTDYSRFFVSHLACHAIAAMGVFDRTIELSTEQQGVCTSNNTSVPPLTVHLGNSLTIHHDAVTVLQKLDVLYRATPLCAAVSWQRITGMYDEAFVISTSISAQSKRSRKYVPIKRKRN